jgi:hypothetical protein
MNHLKTKFNVGDLIRSTDGRLTRIFVLRVFILDNKLYHTFLFRDLSCATICFNINNYELM